MLSGARAIVKGTGCYKTIAPCHHKADAGADRAAPYFSQFALPLAFCITTGRMMHEDMTSAGILFLPREKPAIFRAGFGLVLDFVGRYVGRFIFKAIKLAA